MLSSDLTKRMSLLENDKVVIPSNYRDIRKVVSVSELKHRGLMLRRAVGCLIIMALPVYFLWQTIFQKKYYNSDPHICENSYDR